MNKERYGYKYKLCISIFTSMFLLSSKGFATNAVPGEYLVKVDTSAVSVFDMQAQLGGSESTNIVNASEGIIKITKSMLQRADFTITELKNTPAVLIVEPNYIYKINKSPNDVDLEKLWGMINTGQEIKNKAGVAGVDIGADKAWDVTTGSRDILVAVVDTGIDYNHDDLKDNIWVNQAEKDGKEGVDDDENGLIDDVHGYDFANGDGDPMDDNQHGTHCAGTIGGSGDNEVGVAGVNWKVSIMAVKFLTGSGSGSLENAIKSIDYATNNGAQVMSNSWGGGGKSELLKEAIVRSKDKGVLFVAAAGNDASDNDSRPSYPASYDVENIVSVAAINNKGKLASFSNYGRASVHVAAPGRDIYSTVPGNKYRMLSGTSMAAPHVSGVAALILSDNSELTFADLKARLIETSIESSSLEGKVVGNGYVNAYNAIKNIKPEPNPNNPKYWPTVEKLISTSHPYANSYEGKYTIEVKNAKRISIYFEKFETEKRYDRVTIEDKDGKELAVYEGKLGNFFSEVFETDTLVIKFKTDKSMAKYGFDIKKIAFQNEAAEKK